MHGYYGGIVINNKRGDLRWVQIKVNDSRDNMDVGSQGDIIQDTGLYRYHQKANIIFLVRSKSQAKYFESALPNSITAQDIDHILRHSISHLQSVTITCIIVFIFTESYSIKQSNHKKHKFAKETTLIIKSLI